MIRLVLHNQNARYEVQLEPIASSRDKTGVFLMHEEIQRRVEVFGLRSSLAASAMHRANSPLELGYISDMHEDFKTQLDWLVVMGGIEVV